MAEGVRDVLVAGNVCALLLVDIVRVVSLNNLVSKGIVDGR